MGGFNWMKGLLKGFGWMNGGGGKWLKGLTELNEQAKSGGWEEKMRG